ncbi:MAG TPA: GGDEF domain-containing protein [Syntrophomonadaceae bacterium]|nr:GGDEF domain-containing protein [Syntrophomonadaceae bacterium]
MSGLWLKQTLSLLLITMPLLIIIYPRALHRESTPLHLQTAFFAFPLVAGLVLFYGINLSASAFLAAAQALMTMGFLYLRLLPSPETNQESKEKLIFVSSFLPLLLLIKPALLVYAPWVVCIPVSIALASILPLLILEQNNSDKKPYLTPSLVLLFLAQLTLLGSFSGLQVLSILLHGAAYTSFFMYIYHQSYDHMQSKIAEAQRTLLEWERSVKREVNKRIYEIERSNSRLLDLAKTDAMTQVYNKVNILSIITALTEDRRKRCFTILMFDIDKFKEVNDSRGHLAGDMVIKQVASIASGCVRNIDSVGRYGGDEFLIVLPNTEFTDAHFVAERLRKKVEENESIACTISIGIASYPEDGTSVRDLIKAADEGLYVSKQKGRNTVSHRNDINTSAS